MRYPDQDDKRPASMGFSKTPTLATTKDQYRDPRAVVRAPNMNARMTNLAALLEFTDETPMEHPEWWGRARCGRNGVLGDDPAARVAVMFPSNGGMPGVNTSRAEAICDGCPVRAECRKSNRQLDPVWRYFGVWAGQSAKARIQERRAS